MNYCAIVSAFLLAPGCLFAGDAPTQAEWAPVAAEIDKGGFEAVTMLTDITTKYPKWADGHRALALAKLRSGDAKGSYGSAKIALTINPADIDAGVIGMRALAQQNRKDAAFMVANLFTDATDTGGQVAGEAAMIALQAADTGQLAKYIELAKARAKGAANPVLSFITARQALIAKDLTGAASALEQAIALRPDYRDAIFELGRVRTAMALAQQDASKATELYNTSAEAFNQAARLDSRDAASRFGLGRARLEHGKLMIADGKTAAGEAMLRTALTAFDDGLMIVADDVDAKLWKGDTLLRLQRYREAVPCLRLAFNSGVTDRTLPFNLALALTKSDKGDEAKEVLETLKAETPAEQLTLAMTVFSLKNWTIASDMFEKALKNNDGLPEGPQRNSAFRYYGHCQRELAALEQDPVQRETYINEAVGAYQTAGDGGDFVARRWYLAIQAERSPLKAFEAGKKDRDWYGFFSLSAWKLLAGNYGHKVTRGEGFGGAFSYGLAHVCLWSLLAFIPLGLFVKGWLLPGGIGKGTNNSRKPGPPSAPGSARKPAATATKPGTKATTRTPAKPAAPAAPGAAKTPFGGS